MGRYQHKLEEKEALLGDLHRDGWHRYGKIACAAQQVGAGAPHDGQEGHLGQAASARVETWQLSNSLVFVLAHSRGHKAGEPYGSSN
jgi:hypothetical protein